MDGSSGSADGIRSESYKIRTLHHRNRFQQRSSSSFWVNSGSRPPNRIFSLVIVRSIEFLTFRFPGRRAQKGPAPLLPSLQAAVPHFNMLVFILTHPVSVVKNPSAGFADSFPTHVFLRMFPALGELALSVLPRMSCQFCAL